MDAREVTRNEILEALRSAAGAIELDDAGVTVGELGGALNWGEEKTRRALRDLIRAGRVRAVRVKRQRLDGIVTLVPAYVLAGAP